MNSFFVRLSLFFMSLLPVVSVAMQPSRGEIQGYEFQVEILEGLILKASESDKGPLKEQLRATKKELLMVQVGLEFAEAEQFFTESDVMQEAINRLGNPTQQDYIRLIGQHRKDIASLTALLKNVSKTTEAVPLKNEIWRLNKLMCQNAEKATHGFDGPVPLPDVQLQPMPIALMNEAERKKAEQAMKAIEDFDADI